MFERFSKALLGLFRSDGAGAKGKKKGGKPRTARDQALEQIRNNQDKVMTPQRAELIRNALEVQRAKKMILADLDDEHKQKLVAMAMRAFLNEGNGDAAEAKGKKGAPPAKTAARAKKAGSRKA